MKFFGIILKNVRRNLLRTTLTALGTMVLVFVVTLIWSILFFLDEVTKDKANDFKAIVTERWQLPSQMPFAYADSLARGGARKEGDLKPLDSMSWQFYGGSLEGKLAPEKRTRENILFFFALEPKKVLSMMEELDKLPPSQTVALQDSIKKMEENRRAVVIGREKLAAMNKRVGDRIKVYSLNYKDIDLEFDIVGTFPEETRYGQNAVMNRDYLNAALDDYARTHNGKKHPLAAKSLNLVWLKFPDKEDFSKVAGQLLASPEFTSPAVKAETASSLTSTFLEAYKDLIWGMRWLLAPAILVTLSLVIANAISISVRERRMEFAILKVLGFRPGHILAQILGEALLIGASAGILSAGLTYVIVNKVMGGFRFPIGFFGAFMIPLEAVWWGLGIGAATALIGSFVPAWTARKVRVADVFSKVA